MENLVCSKYGKFYISSAKGISDFVAWGSCDKLNSEDPISEDPNIDVWFNFGETREEAIGNVLEELESIEFS